MKKFKPLLSGEFSITDCLFPIIASPKIDGVRCLIKDGVAVSRSLKPLPNKYLQSLLSYFTLSGLDGEIVVGSPTSHDCFNKTTKFVMSQDTISEFTYLVFDDFTNPQTGFTYRLQQSFDRVLEYRLGRMISYIESVNHVHITSKIQMENYHAKNISMGYEGTMIRSPFGIYKYGRSTNKEAILLKWKPYHDSEAIVLGVEELLINKNPPDIDILGHTVRSSHKENKILSETLGALIVKDIYSGVKFKVGTGFSTSDRTIIWRDKNKFIGKTIKYKFNETVKDKPRHPVFMYWMT